MKRTKQEQQNVDKSQTLQKLLSKPKDKIHINLIQKIPPQRMSPQMNESFRSSPKIQPSTQPSYLSKIKSGIALQNVSIEESNGVNLELDDRKQSHSVMSTIKSLYRLSSKNFASKKLLGPTSPQTSAKSVSNRIDHHKDSCDSTKRIQTSYIDLKQPISSIQKEDNTDLYLQIIKMRQNQIEPHEKKCPHHPKMEIQFSNLERSQEYCALCAINQAYKGQPLVHLLSQSILGPAPPIPTQQQFSDVVWNLDQICSSQRIIHLQSKDYLQKKQDLQTFITYLQQTHDQVELLTQDYQKYQSSSDINETSQGQIDLLCSTISSLVKRYLNTHYKPQDQNQLKSLLPEKIHYLQTFQNDINCIRNDIVQNVENILKQMEMDPFQLILQKYGTKIQTFESILKRSHAQMQDHFGICFGAQIGENAQDTLYTWVQSILKDESFIQPSSNSCPVYVSFENKEIFNTRSHKDSNKENQYDKQFDNMELVQQQRQSQTTKFVDLLDKINSNQNQKTLFLTSFLAPQNENGQNYSKEHTRQEDGGQYAWKDIQKSPQFKENNYH